MSVLRTAFILLPLLLTACSSGPKVIDLTSQPKTPVGVKGQPIAPADAEVSGDLIIHQRLSPVKDGEYWRFE
ncbi:MAG: hypothetical protein AAGA45_00010 [Verrucomicrobiota bacterium]